MFGMNFGSKDVSAKAKEDLMAYCEKHNSTDIKALLMSDEHGEEGLKIMYKHIPKPMKLIMAMSESKFIALMKEHKDMIFAQIPNGMLMDMEDMKKNKE